MSSYDVPTSVSRDLANSEPVYSSLLLLDGSSISTTADVFGGEIMPKISDSDCLGDSSLEIRDEVAWEIAKSPIGPRAGNPELSSKLASSSILNIGKQLGHKFSAEYLKHVNSVLRYSSSNSWRSSLGSLSSRASSLMSRNAAHDKSNTVVLGLTVEEHKIWKELVDESRLKPTVTSRPQYGTISLLRRLCCRRDVSGVVVCWKCGFTPQHRQAIESASISLVDAGDPPFKNRGDFYDNTPLHCAAASVGHGEFWKIRSIVRQGVEVDRCNTFGETFLHILCRKGPRTLKDTDDFLLLLMDLSKAGFPFFKHDYHGRTILHVLLQHSYNYVYDVLVLQQMFSITEPNLKSRDNSGLSIKDHLEAPRALYSKDNWLQLAALIAPYCTSFSDSTHFWQSDPAIESDFGKFLLQGSFAHCPAWIDSAGDTPLASLLKNWRNDSAGDTPLASLLKNWRNDSKDSKGLILLDDINEMLKAGAVIEMRDRNGNTALAIAARRGFRSIVLLLLKAGANVHARNYHGIGILKQVEEAMARVADDSRLWARKCSCYVALGDAGAISSPSSYDEWKSRDARNLAASPHWSEQSHTVHEPPEGDPPSHWLGSGDDV
jgi:ankyrin repeat protein